MKTIIQRVSSAVLYVGGDLIAETGAGLVVFVGIEKGDGISEAEKTAAKITSLRIFADESGKMNLSVAQTGGEILLVSQFTLCADTRGNRPGFDSAMPPKDAEKLFELTAEFLRQKGQRVSMGVFGADMQIFQVNDGPVTIAYNCKAD